jgi:hypothetical protein
VQEAYRQHRDRELPRRDRRVMVASLDPRHDFHSVIASEAKQSRDRARFWIASSLRSSQ